MPHPSRVTTRPVSSPARTLHVLVLHVVANSVATAAVLLQVAIRYVPTTLLCASKPQLLSSGMVWALLASHRSHGLQGLSRGSSSQDLHDWPAELPQRWAQHTFRVSGAQTFARANLDLHVIMLLGCCGSAAIVRYVQEVAIADPPRRPQPSLTKSHCSHRACLRLPSLQLWPSCHLHWTRFALWLLTASGVERTCHNVRSKLAHKPCATECSPSSVAISLRSQEVWKSQLPAEPFLGARF